MSKIATIPKGEDTTDIINHRPIALIPVPAKIFQSILERQIIYAQEDNQIANSQHKLRRGRGIQTNLASFTLYLSEHLDRSVQVDTVFTDFKKVFDNVNHSLS